MGSIPTSPMRFFHKLPLNLTAVPIPMLNGPSFGTHNSYALSPINENLITSLYAHLAILLKEGNFDLDQ